VPHKVDNKVTKALYEMGCDDKAYAVFLLSEKEFCELSYEKIK